jgi:1,2-diacylglycerol 3-beta-galactosyltransferase
MAEYMVACDCIISKAGPGTIAEAMICGIPIVLNGTEILVIYISVILIFPAGCIPCQEEGNIPYVIENGVGAYSEEPQTIAHIVAGWLDPQNTKELRDMSMRAQRLGRPAATYNIVRDLARMAV